MLAEPLPHEILDLAGQGVVTRAIGDDEGLHDLPAQWIRHADGGGFAHRRMLQDGILDLDRAHRPAGRDDDIVGAAAVIEVAVLVRPAEILGRDPAVAPPDLELARDAGRARFAGRIVDLDLAARDGLAQRSRLDHKIFRARIADQDHADLGGAVHAARRMAECRLDEGRRLAVDRLAGEGQFLQGVAVARRGAGIPHHAIVGGRRGDVGEAVILQRLQEPLGVELAGIGADGDAQCQGRQGAVPQAVSPGRR